MSDSVIQIYCPRATSRIKYACNLVFRDVLRQPFELTNNATDFKTNSGPKLSYAYQSIDDSLNIVPNGLLEKTGIEQFDIQVSSESGIETFFKTSGKEIGFDLFAASFFLATRYEEYWPHVSDKHGRFSAKESIAFQNNFLNKPLINLWADNLFGLLRTRYPELKDNRKYSFQPTFDVDNAYAYLEKGIVRTAGAFARSLFQLNFRDLKKRSRVLLGLDEDPYEVFDVLIDLQKKYEVKPIYFFLVGDYGLNDKNVPIHSRRFQSLIKHINDYALVGLHPSYASFSEPERLLLERERLSNVVHDNIVRSRQHFLMLDLPRSYRELSESDITDDYTMGYPETPGFRASVCSPYSFYDLEMEKETSLKIHPFSFMEATFKYYQELSTQEMLNLLQDQANTVKALKGELCVLWHSDSLSETEEWLGWSSLFEEALKIGRE